MVILDFAPQWCWSYSPRPEDQWNIHFRTVVCDVILPSSSIARMISEMFMPSPINEWFAPFGSQKDKTLQDYPFCLIRTAILHFTLSLCQRLTTAILHVHTHTSSMYSSVLTDSPRLVWQSISSQHCELQNRIAYYFHCIKQHSIAFYWLWLSIYHRYTWTSLLHVFPPGICVDPGTLTNGRRTLTGTTVNSRVTYTCNAGYTLQGPSSRTCQANRRWSGSLPRCICKFSLCFLVLVRLRSSFSWLCKNSAD